MTAARPDAKTPVDVVQGVVVVGQVRVPRLGPLAIRPTLRMTLPGAMRDVSLHGTANGAAKAKTQRAGLQGT